MRKLLALIFVFFSTAVFAQYGHNIGSTISSPFNVDSIAVNGLSIGESDFYTASNGDLYVTSTRDIVLTVGTNRNVNVIGEVLKVNNASCFYRTGNIMRIGSNKGDDIYLRTNSGEEHLYIIHSTGYIGIDTATPTCNLDINGSVAISISTPDLTGNSYTIASGDYFILIDDDDADVTGTVVVALPAAASNTGRVLIIKKIGSSYTVQLDGNGAETIDESTTQDITTQYNSLTIQCDGNNWWIQ